MERNAMNNFMLMILSVLLLTGCGSGTTEDDTMNGEGPITREQTDLPFSTIDVDEAPDRIGKWIEKNRSEEAKKVFHVDGKTYVIILLGEKSTGGYHVEIEQIQLSKIVSPESEAGPGTVEVTYNVTEPEEGSFNIQALTYPMAIAELGRELEYGFQFNSPAKSGELKESQDQPDDNDSSKQQASDGGQSVLVSPEELTSDGEIKE
ncbi:protease complex subunit PrcB family protein [Lentibacillus sp. CBA3610]|uniref:protease complex subunit PrcB family protein n=1 Tax=Lentibacillus sp. CBA3610 TaxID=2518176 RepID=UPI001595C8B8|nr:protease complex subunit PrcB family protein [Lentibacillus sp. CBA3610]QKY70722.1 protease complex subunit PrcB family protein [Lentibacillus sp. CBA3610]